MQCFCENKKTNDIKVEGDVGADPLWCHERGQQLTEKVQTELGTTYTPNITGHYDHFSNRD